MNAASSLTAELPAFGSKAPSPPRSAVSRQTHTPKRVCAESNLLEQLSSHFRRMTGKLTDAGTRPLSGVLGKRSCERSNRNAARGPSAVGLSSGYAN
jgi:hypothetical protein